MGSFDTPVKVEFETFEADQLLEILLYSPGLRGRYKEGESGEAAAGPNLAMKVDGNVVGETFDNDGAESNYGKWVPLCSYSGGLYLDHLNRQESAPLAPTQPNAMHGPISANQAPANKRPELGAEPLLVRVDAGTHVVELQAKAFIGWVKLIAPAMYVRSWG